MSNTESFDDSLEDTVPVSSPLIAKQIQTTMQKEDVYPDVMQIESVLSNAAKNEMEAIKIKVFRELIMTAKKIAEKEGSEIVLLKHMRDAERSVRLGSIPKPVRQRAITLIEDLSSPLAAAFYILVISIGFKSVAPLVVPILLVYIIMFNYALSVWNRQRNNNL